MNGRTMKLGILAFALALLAGCSTMRWDTAEHHVSVERASPDYVELSQIYVGEAEKGVTVSGELSPRRITEEIPPGHVNIVIVARDGVTVVETSTHIHRIGKLLKRPQRYSFSAAIPIIPPEGSIIRVTFEGDP